MSPEDPVQNMALVSQIAGPVDAARLAWAFDRVIGASDVMRTRLVRRSDPAGGAATEAAELVPFDGDAGVLSELIECSHDELMALAHDRVATPLDMSVQGFDSVIASHSDGSCSWYLNVHHVLTDATSSALFFDAVADAYHGHDIDVASYYDWADGLAASFESKAARRAQEHWQARPKAAALDGLYRPDPGSRTGGTSASRRRLQLTSRLMEQCAQRLESDYRMLSEDLGWTVLLTSATALYIHRVTGSTSFSLGLPVHHRGRPETKDLIGPTMEVFPVDIEIDPDDTHRTLHQRVGRSVISTLQHALPGTAPAADYQGVVNVIPRAEQDMFGPYRTTTEWIHPGAIDGSHLMRVQMTRYAEGANLEFAIDVNDRVADQQQQERAAHHFETVIDFMVSHPDATVGGYGILADDEQKILDAWGYREPVAPYGIDLTQLDNTERPPITEQLLSALVSNGDTVIDHNGATVTGGELARWVTSVAHWLVDEGVDPGDRVGVNLPRSPEAVVAILAVMSAGASFVPLDPDQPEVRRLRLVERAECRMVLSSIEQLAELAPWRTSVQPAMVPRPRPVVERSPDDEAYLLFTSGSTGEPKGVPISHRGLAGYVDFAASTYVLTDEKVCAALFSALTFDLTITTLFVPLLTGGGLVIIDQNGLPGLTTIAGRTEISWLKATPSHLELLVRLLPKDHRLRTLVVGGEAFGTALADELLAFNANARIFNEYGPTEAVVGCMDYLVEPDLSARQAALGSDAVPIGRPAPGVSLRIVDEHLRPVPVGSPGELLISHSGLSVGYLDEGMGDGGPFIRLDGQRFYRSGDLVRLQDHERLVYLGRIDEQVKVGGIRLEPIEVEQALVRHRDIERCAVRVWSPGGEATDVAKPDNHCVRCGLPDNVPEAEFDVNGVCSTCHAYDRVAPVADGWFKDPDDLRREIEWAQANRTGEHDVLHLLSGGKDSTFALYQLVEAGAHPYVLTLDNGFISEGAKDNCRASVADLGLDHEFVTTEAMNAIFADSLATYSNVCNGCYKAIYTLATTRADQLGIPMIVTGLSRGQLFETRLIPQQFSLDRFDPDAIDRAVIEARKVYHRTPDAATRLLDTDVFNDDAVFDRIRYLDFYRYMDVELADMLDFLNNRAPWVRPADTGRSTNCLVNAAGIHTHLTEQGYHNYAIPYAWDVRLGHKTRDEAIEELDDELDLDDVQLMLSEIGYEPRRREILTAWIERGTIEGSDPGAKPVDPGELRVFLSGLLPDYAIPSAFVEVDTLPLTTNGKLDVAALPPPERVHRPSVGMFVAAGSDTERSVVDIWERILGVEPISVDDDFFALGGDSLAALEMIVAIGDRLGVSAAEDLAFRHTTPRELAAAIDALATGGTNTPSDGPPPPMGINGIPELSDGERAVLFDQGQRPADVMYNVGRSYRLNALDFALSSGSDGSPPKPVQPERLRVALEQVVVRHQSLSWTYGAPRRQLSADQALEFTVGERAEADQVEAMLAAVHRAPFDLVNGPLLRCHIQPEEDGSAHVLLVIHHASGDADSFAVIWDEVNTILDGGEPGELVTDYAGFCQWQRETFKSDDHQYWLDQAADAAKRDREPGRLAAVNGRSSGDGYLKQVATVSPAELMASDGATPFAVALAGISSALTGYWSNDVVELGLITSARNDRAANGLVGYFLNTVPLVLEPAEAESMGQLARQTSQQLGGILSHRSYPLAQILADRAAAGLAASAPTVLVAYDELSTTEIRGIAATQTVLSNGSAVADATIFVERRADQIDLSLEYRGSVFSPESAQALLDSVDRLIASAATDPSATTMPEDDQVDGAQLLVGDDPQLPDEPPLPLFAERLAQHLRVSAIDSAAGEFAAVLCGDDRLSWFELNQASAALASRLHEAGVGRGDRVVVSVPRSLEQLLALVAVLRVGAVYVPVDPTYPDQRISMLVKAASAAAALVSHDEALVPAILSTVAMPVLAVSALDALDGVDTQPESQSRSAWQAPPMAPDDPAYLIFTSGSTGVPKPVVISHGQISASTNARSVFYRSESPPETDSSDGSDTSTESALVDEAFRFLMVSSISFDSSIVGLFWTLAEGGTLILPTEEQVHDFDALAELMSDCRVTHTLMVPTLYSGVLSALQRSGGARALTQSPAWPGQVIVAGESCPPSLVAAHYEAFPFSRMANEYGPTEASVWITAHHVARFDDPVPIGRPIPGSWAIVVGSDGKPTPAGVAGELVVGGPGVATDYGVPIADLGSWTSTLESRNPILGGLAYRTGDRVVVHDGTIDFLGRVDNQLNVNGVRVEPEEIEGTILADATSASQTEAPSVSAAVVVASQRVTAAGTTVTELVAHLEVPATEDEFAEDALVEHVRQAVASQLPDRARPSRYVIHRGLPRSPNGKIDRTAAASLAVPDAVVAADAPVDAEVEQKLAVLFARALGQSDFDPAMSFFDAGGHSLLAIDLVMSIEESTGTQVPVATLYRAPSPRELAIAVAETASAVGENRAQISGQVAPGQSSTGRPSAADTGLLIPIQPNGDKPPIFAIHVLGVDCAFFRPLSAELGDSQPMYGLGQPRAELDTEVSSDVGEIASAYVRHIVETAPDGPLVLAAISLGGVVAYETAQQLTQAGREVQLLAMFDSFGPDAELDRSLREKIRYHADSFRAEPRQYLAGRVDHEGRRLQRWAELAEMKARDRLSLPSTHRVDVRRYIEENIGNQTAYDFRPYGGTVVAYKAAEEPNTDVQVAAHMGWRRVVEGDLAIEVAGGHHHNMMMSPHVESLARSLVNHLDGT